MYMHANILPQDHTHAKKKIRRNYVNMHYLQNMNEKIA